MVVTGDLTQSDLPKGAAGLDEAVRVLAGIEGIATVRLEGRDVVRNSIVSQIIAAYDAAAEKGRR